MANTWAELAAKAAESLARDEFDEGSTELGLALLGVEPVKALAEVFDRVESRRGLEVVQHVNEGRWSDARRAYIENDAELDEIFAAAESSLKQAMLSHAHRIVREEEANELWDSALEAFLSVGRAALEIGLPLLIRAIEGLISGSVGSED